MSEKDVEERKFVVLLDLVSKFEARVDGGKAFGEFYVCCIRGVLTQNTMGVIHVADERTRDGDTFFFSDFCSFFEGVVHPYLREDDHERKTDGTRITGSVVFVVIDEIRSGEAEADEVDEVRWRERCSR